MYVCENSLPLDGLTDLAKFAPLQKAGARFPKDHKLSKVPEMNALATNRHAKGQSNTPPLKKE